MAVYYLAGFSTSGAQAMGVNLSAVQVAVTAATYAHRSFASVLTAGGYTSFPLIVKTVFDAAAGANYTVSFSTTTYKYTISQAATFSMAFSTATVPANGTRLRLALGFTGDKSGTNTYTSDVIPYYVVGATVSARSAFTDVYEPDDIVEEAVSDGGTPYAVSKNTTELWSDWSQTMETKAATLTRSAVAATPWTWQAFVKHVRGQRPFGVYDSAVADTLHRMRSDTASFKPDRVAADYDGLWNIPFHTRDLGVLT